MHNHKIQTQHFTELQCNKLKKCKKRPTTSPCDTNE